MVLNITMIAKGIKPNNYKKSYACKLLVMR